MADDSLDEFLSWDIAQNKTETAWSSTKVPVKNRGRKTYGRSRGGSFSSQRRTISESDEYIIGNTLLNDGVPEEEEEQLDAEPLVPPPVPSRPKFLRRANSVTIHDRQSTTTKLRRSNSISFNARDDTVKRGSFPRRSSISIQPSSRSVDSFSENAHPNLSVLEEFVSPKRPKNTVEFPGRKRVKSDDATGLKVPLSESFSNLAKFGEDGLSWAKPGGTEATSSSFNNSGSSFQEGDYFEKINFSESSPAGESVGSSRKRGIMESPIDDFDDIDFFSGEPSIRRSRFFSPARTPVGSSNAAGTGSASLMSVGSEDRPRMREESVDTDDDLSTDAVSVDSLMEAKTPMNNVSHYGNHSIGGLSPDMLDVRNAGPDDIINSMSSYLDLRFLVKSLRKERASSRTSWHVAPPVSWEAQRRSAFLYWASRTLGFSFRSGGMAITYLQISKAKGAEILQLLEAAVTSYKDKGFAEQTPRDSSTKLKFTFSSVKKAATPRALALTPKESATTLFDAGNSELVDDLSSKMMSLEMSDKKKKDVRFSDHYLPVRGMILEDSDDMSFMEASRPSMENHTNARDLMAHMHGVTPIPRKGRPPRLSIESTGSAGVSGMSGGIFDDISPYPQTAVRPAQHCGNDCMTPMVTKPDLGWGSCPIAGRDWGASEACSPTIIEELVRRMDQSVADAGIVDDTTTPFGSDSSNLFDLELEAAASNEHETRASSLDTPGGIFESALDPILQTKQDRRRQTSFAKHARMSLIASAVNPGGSMLNGRKSLFDRPSKAFLGTDFALAETLESTPAFVPYNEASLDDPVCSRRTALADAGVLETILSFLQEAELLCTASLVSIQWADCATQAHANMMLMSVGCTSGSDTGSNNDDDSVVQEAVPTYGFMDREWEFLVSNFPWACFLSEGAFKRVYKVFNYNHRVEEAISVMDVDTIESTGNMNVVGAELAVSVLLSSLVRRGVCPNFVVTRGVFSCAYEPPSRSWGSATDKRPKGSSYVSPKVKRLPKEPGQNKRGRYQYIRMELCDEGDAEEYLKRQYDGAIDPHESMKLLFQMAFSLHAAADRFSLKHYDVKLLNFFLQGVTTEKVGDVVMRYGLGEHTFALKSKRGQGIIAKLADYGTANVDSGSCGQAVTIAQFTTLENTPIDFLIRGDAARQGHGHDCFGLGLCMLHLFTGHAPYEEILEQVACPQSLKKELRLIWENEAESEYSVIRSLILSEVYKDEEGHIIEGEPDETLYDTLYRFLVLFGIPDLTSKLSNSKVWVAIKNTLENKPKKSGKKNQRNDSIQFNTDRRKYSLVRGNNKYIARARKSLESLHGGMELLLSLVSFDPQARASALDVLNSPFMAPLREEEGGGSQYSEDDEVLTYNAFSIKRT